MPRPVFSHPITLHDHDPWQGRTVTATETITLPHDLIVADASGGSFTLTLPGAKFTRGHQFLIVKSNVGNVVTIAAAPGDGIGFNLAASVALNARDDHVFLVSSGTTVWVKIV